MKIITKLWIGLGILVILTPLGLLLPEYFKAGSAWGEWGIDEINQLTGYVPRGLEKFSALWSAPMPDYTFKGWEGSGVLGQIFVYILSAIAGAVICAAIFLVLGKFLSKK